MHLHVTEALRTSFVRLANRLFAAAVWGWRCFPAALRPRFRPWAMLTKRSMRFPPRTDQASRQHRRRETAA